MSETKGAGNYRAATEIVQLNIEPDPSGPGIPPPPKPALRQPFHERTLPAKGFLRKETYKLPAADGAPQKVSDIMTRQVIAIEPDSKLDVIEDGMRRFGIRHLPVIEGDNRLVGVLSHRELVHAEASSLAEDRAEQDALILKNATVSQIMSRQPIIIGPNASLKEAGRLLLQYKIGCLPVVEDGNRLVGIITSSDFIKLAMHYVGKAGG